MISDILPVIVSSSLLLVFCATMVALTNRAFGHATFFRCLPANTDSSGTKKTKADSSFVSTFGSKMKGSMHTTISHHHKTRRAGWSDQNKNPGGSDRLDDRDAETLDHQHPIFFFATAPVGVIEHIGYFLFPAELVDISSVSCDLRATMGESPVLWREHCSRNFGSNIQEGGRIVGDAWREEMMRRFAVTESYEEQAIARDSNANARDRGTERPASSPLGPNGDASTAAVVDVTSEKDATSLREEHRKANIPLQRENRPAHEDGQSSISSNLKLNSDEARVESDHRSPFSTRRQRPRTPFFDASSSSLSWKRAFFFAHHVHPKQMLEAARLASLSTSTSRSSDASPPVCVIMVAGRLYDLTAFLSDHPGGASILQEHAFTDATHAFERFFHSREARRIAQGFVVWDGVNIIGRRGTLRTLCSAQRSKRAALEVPIVSVRRKSVRVFQDAIRRWTRDRLFTVAGGDTGENLHSRQ